MSRRNQIGQGGAGRQLSKHRGDRPGRSSAVLGQSDVSTGSNLKVNKRGQLSVSKAKAIRPLVVGSAEDNAENIDKIAASVNEIIQALKDAKLMEDL